jgi:glycosyltransferase involved in cell wall biosynthesis
MYMKIGILTSYFFQEISEIHGKDRIIFGGAEKYLYELCHFLQSEGHSVTVWQPISIPKDIDPKAVPAQIKKEYKGIPIICLPHLNNWTPMGTNPELNQFFNEAANYYDIAVYFVTFLAFPHVVKHSITISHGIYWDYPHCNYGMASDDGKREFLRQHLYGFEAPAVCIAVDSNVKRVVQAIKPGAETNIRVIPNFVDCEKFKPVEKTWEGIRVLYPRRLSILRGQNEFIRATQLHPEYQYLAVGQATREDTEQKAADWAKTLPHLKFIHKEMDGMEEVYQQSDIAVIPTKACEGLSLSVLESFACGLPVITTHAGGIGDAVIDGYNALVFDPASDNLADYIHYLAQDERLRKIYGERNREIARCFDIKVWHEKWKQIINSF